MTTGKLKRDNPGKYKKHLQLDFFKEITDVQTRV
jgi:hypothetical protein